MWKIYLPSTPFAFYFAADVCLLWAFLAQRLHLPQLLVFPAIRISLQLLVLLQLILILQLRTLPQLPRCLKFTFYCPLINETWKYNTSKYNCLETKLVPGLAFSAQQPHPKVLKSNQPVDRLYTLAALQCHPTNTYVHVHKNTKHPMFLNLNLVKVLFVHMMPPTKQALWGRTSFAGVHISFSFGSSLFRFVVWLNISLKRWINGQMCSIKP